MNSKREIWIDYIKVFACILVALGHFFQSMVAAEILPETELHQWFDTTIYYFHVPLFFICSGYLYQKYSCVNSVGAWKNNVIKKAITLGVPYFVFSFATWLLKTVFSGSVNGQIGGLGDTLFLYPTSPYWFLYILFFIFLVTPTVKTFTGMVVLIGIATAGKVLQIIGGGGYSRDIIICTVVMLISLICRLINRDLPHWFTESYGFIYGIVLYRLLDKFKELSNKKMDDKNRYDISFKPYTWRFVY